ncbi:hypothetical protein [Paenibacillus yanchengensis]|uniref:Uncharacterized protein n=1 Tax=Paenibacillus yanchengensis TaxID=2035833 RepID=A0ABW4YHI7_9BACL
MDHTDIVFYENAAGQDFDATFAGPGASCNILTETWFWRKADSTMELKSVDWALQKVEEANHHNVTFLLNAAPNQLGLIDENIVKQFKAVGERYNKPAKLEEVPENWLHRLK